MQTKLQQKTDELVKESINEIFYQLHKEFKTKSGDITPEQDLMLDYYTTQLSKLISEQVKQNL
jgi:hypothetical protein